MLLTFTILLFAAMLIVGTVYADTSGTSVGTATITSVAPTISSVELWNLAEDTDKNNTALDSNNIEYHLNFTVSTASTMTNLKNATIKAWDNRGQAEIDADSQRYHYTWTWVESTDTWNCPLSANYIATANCSDPGTGSALTTYEFRLAFKLSKVANYSNGGSYDGWQFKIYVYDDAANTATYGQGTGGRTQFGVASYLGVTITDTTHAWTADSNTADNAVSAGGDGKVDFTVVANRVWKARVESNQSALQGQGAIAGQYIVIANVTQYGSDAVGSSIPLTTEYADVTGITSVAAPADEASPTQKGVYLWLDVPDATQPGVYSYELSILVANQ